MIIPSPYEMEDSFLKKLCLLVSILPLFGCNNTDDKVSLKSDKQNYTQIYEQVPSPAIQKTGNPAALNTEVNQQSSQKGFNDAGRCINKTKSRAKIWV